MSPSGYSGTALAKKLGFKEGSRVLVLDGPEHYVALLEPLPPGVEFVTRAGPSVDIAHAFVTERGVLAKVVSDLRKKLRPDAVLWISWPKKAAKMIPSTVTEDVIREVALPLGWVDVKVCAVTDVWSGLKLVVRKELRA